jgi:hypothetical protein
MLVGLVSMNLSEIYCDNVRIQKLILQAVLDIVPWAEQCIRFF